MFKPYRFGLFVALFSSALPTFAGVADFSPDSKQIVYPWPSGLAVQAVDGTRLDPVPGGESATMARWAPNGRFILFATAGAGTAEVKRFITATGKTRSEGGNLGGPLAWREDGGRFACIHRPPAGGTELLEYSAIEGGIVLRSPLPVAVDPYAPMVWLPGSDDVAFVGTDSNVYTVEAGETHRITNSNDVIGLALFAGGKKLVWARRGPNLHYILMSVYAYDLSARNVARLPFPDRVPTLNPDPRHAPASIDRVEFSPDGQRLALILMPERLGRPSRVPVSTFAVYSVAMNGRDGRLVAGGPSATALVSARFSLDGRQLAVVVRSPAARLVIAASDGSGAHALRAEAGQ